MNRAKYFFYTLGAIFILIALLVTILAVKDFSGFSWEVKKILFTSILSIFFLVAAIVYLKKNKLVPGSIILITGPILCWLLVYVATPWLVATYVDYQKRPKVVKKIPQPTSEKYWPVLTNVVPWPKPVKVEPVSRVYSQDFTLLNSGDTTIVFEVKPGFKYETYSLNGNDYTLVVLTPESIPSGALTEYPVKTLGYKRILRDKSRPFKFFLRAEQEGTEVQVKIFPS